MPDPSTYPNPVSETATASVTCPRCDRTYHAATEEAAMEMLEDHVKNQHPDHDPEWASD